MKVPTTVVSDMLDAFAPLSGRGIDVSTDVGGVITPTNSGVGGKGRRGKNVRKSAPAAAATATTTKVVSPTPFLSPSLTGLVSDDKLSLLVLSYMGDKSDPRDLLSLGATCKGWRERGSDERLWSLSG